MKKLLPVFFLAGLTFSFSQVGIGTTTPDLSSVLEISSVNKGLLIPRISIANLNSAAPVTTPVESLLIYNTNLSTGVGFHYWDGTKWSPLSSSTEWTTSGTDIYNTNSGSIGIGTNSPTTLLHLEGNTPGTINALNDGFEDNTIAPFMTNGSGGAWNITSGAGEYNTGTYGVGSGSGITNGDSILDLNVVIPTGGSAFSFNYRVNSEANYDFLRFYIDGVLQTGASWSGNVNWNNYAGTLTAGAHTLSWRYEKDGSVNTGLDRAFIDDISITSTTTVQPILRIVDGTQGTGRVLTSDANGNASWQAISSIAPIAPIIPTDAISKSKNIITKIERLEKELKKQSEIITKLLAENKI